jgi:glycosyltransferase involved in cell wall biosynthesis
MLPKTRKDVVVSFSQSRENAMQDHGLSYDEPLAYLFMVREGPTYSLEDLEAACLLLSQRFRGELWSYGSYEADVEVGRMRIRVIKDRSLRKLINFPVFALTVLRRTRELRVSRPERLVVTSYDPFKGGLLAWRVSRLLGGAFLCEVNGVYGNPDNFSHIRSAPWRWLRLLQVRVLGSFVLRRADAVRLLFTGQLENFVKLKSATTVRQFFDRAYTERFYPGPEEPLILAVGFPFMIKGVDILVSAFRRIAPRHPTWTLVLIGHRIPDELRARGLEHPQIHSLPGLPQRELAKWVSRCSILALASRTEGIPRVLLEGAAAGKCRIASRVGGVPTVLTHGIDGLLFEKENVLQLAESLERAIEDKNLRVRLGGVARERVAREFSASAYLEHYTELVSATLAARGAEQPKAAKPRAYGA